MIACCHPLLYSKPTKGKKKSKNTIVYYYCVLCNKTTKENDDNCHWPLHGNTSIKEDNNICSRLHLLLKQKEEKKKVTVVVATIAFFMKLNQRKRWRPLSLSSSFQAKRRTKKVMIPSCHHFLRNTIIEEGNNNYCHFLDSYTSQKKRQR